MQTTIYIFIVNILNKNYACCDKVIYYLYEGSFLFPVTTLQKVITSYTF